MSTHSQNPNEKIFHLENGLAVFNTELDKMKREQEDARQRDSDYRNKQIELDGKMVTLTRLLVLCAILSSGVGGTQACIYWRQARLMEASLNQNERTWILGMGQLGIANRNAKTSEKTLTNSQKTFEMDERPYLVMDSRNPIFALNGFVPNQKLSVNVNFKNIGKEPAIRQIMEMNLVNYQGPDAKLTPTQYRDRIRSFTDNWFDKMRRKAKKGSDEMVEYVSGHGEDVAPGDSWFASTNDDSLSPAGVGSVTTYFVGRMFCVNSPRTSSNCCVSSVRLGRILKQAGDV